MLGLVSDFKGWSKTEYCWLIVAMVATGVASLGGSTLELVAALTNVLCVILVAKGRVSNYIWGTIGVLTYGWVSYQNHLYGNAALNLLYYLPMQFIGIAAWLKNKAATDVYVKPMGIRGYIFYAAITVVATTVFSFILKASNDPFPVLDAFTSVGSVIAMLMMVRRLAAQWVLWILIDIVTVYIWWSTTASEGRSYAMVAMWVAFTGNALYGAYKWYVTKENK